MGWTEVAKPDKSIRDYFAEKMNGDIYEIVDSAVYQHVAYFLIHNKQSDTYEASVILLKYTRDGRFLYKDMDEFCGPVESTCPARILERLSPTDHVYANAWRARCWAHVRKIETAKEIKPGAALNFAEGLDFGRGRLFTRFRYEPSKRYRNLFFCVDGGFLCRITNWKERDFQIVREE